MSALDTTQYPSSELQGSYAYPDTLKGVFYGPGSLETALPSLLKALGGKKAFVITGKSLYTKTDVVKKVVDVLTKQNAYAGVFHDIGQHSPVAGIKSGLQAFKDNGADIFVSVGGGSPIDATKAMIYFLQKETGGLFARHIAIPTTLSAAEYTQGAGYTNEEGSKVAASAPELSISGIILDAQLTLATPERLWLSTGLRALDHAIEGLYRQLFAPPLKHLCYAAMADLFKYLPLSKANPQDIAVRQKLQIASWMSLWPVKIERYAGIGLSHALGHKLGATYQIPHGITSCLTLAPVIALKADTASEEDKRWLADAFLYLRKPTTGSQEGDIRALAAAVQGLVDDLGLHSTLTEYSVPREDIPGIAERAMGGKGDPTYPQVVKLLEGLY